MSRLIELMADEHYYACPPATLTGSANPDHWVPGSYCYSSGDGVIHLVVVIPEASGDVNGFAMEERAGAIALHAPVGLKPADCVADAIDEGTSKFLSDAQVRALVGHANYWAASFPAHENRGAEQWSAKPAELSRQ